jgi:hypothetical protein
MEKDYVGRKIPLRTVALKKDDIDDDNNNNNNNNNAVIFEIHQLLPTTMRRPASVLLCFAKLIFETETTNGMAVY